MDSTLIEGQDLRSVKMVEHLLGQGLNINAQDRNGNTALHIGAPSAPCVTVLLKHGANPNIVNGKGLTPLLCVIKSATGEDERLLRKSSGQCSCSLPEDEALSS